MRIWQAPGRDRLAVLGGLLAPLALAAVLVPFRASFPNTDAALALILVVVAVAANGYRPVGYLAGLPACSTTGRSLRQSSGPGTWTPRASPGHRHRAAG
jgi:hypothetical protein